VISSMTGTDINRQALTALGIGSRRTTRHRGSVPHWGSA
jgi:hypothetical protein